MVPDGASIGKVAPHGDSFSRHFFKVGNDALDIIGTCGTKAFILYVYLCRLRDDNDVCLPVSAKKIAKVRKELDEAQKTSVIEGAATNDEAFFREMKALTVTGFCTSEIGATQVLEYLPIPGKFEGDVPLQPGQKAWAITR